MLASVVHFPEIVSHMARKLDLSSNRAGSSPPEGFGMATPADVDIETLTRRLGDEVVARNATVVGPSLVGACSRKPEESSRLPYDSIAEGTGEES